MMIEAIKRVVIFFAWDLPFFLVKVGLVLGVLLGVGSCLFNAA